MPESTTVPEAAAPSIASAREAADFPRPTTILEDVTVPRSELAVMVTFIIVWKLAAGLGLYWASSSLVGIFQTLWLRSRTDAKPYPCG